MNNISVEQLSVNGKKFYPKVSISSIVDTPEGGFAKQGDNPEATNSEIERKVAEIYTLIDARATDEEVHNYLNSGNNPEVTNSEIDRKLSELSTKVAEIYTLIDARATDEEVYNYLNS